MIRAKYGRHTFPNRTARWRVRVATKRPRVCDTIEREPPEGHTRLIAKGSQYVNVGIPDELEGRPWRHVDLCPACAIGYGIAEELEPDPELKELEEARA